MKSTTEQLKLTHLDKVLWTEEGYTKGDMIHYYEQMSDYVVPYLKDRPIMLHRYPNGIHKSSFYQKELGPHPDWVQTVEIEHEDHLVNYVLIQNANTLLYVANLGSIDLHPFHVRISHYDNPDYLILDLDPEAIDFQFVIEAAQMIHKVLDSMDLFNLCKTSGGRGLHIYVPLNHQLDHEKVKEMSKAIASAVHQALPSTTSLIRNPKDRQKKVYIDYLRNSRGQTIVAPYSLRPKPNAPVSTPLKWNEVKKGLEPQEFNIQTVPKRVKKLGDLFKPLLKTF